MEEQERLRDEGEQHEEAERQRLELGWDLSDAERKQMEEEEHILKHDID